MKTFNPDGITPPASNYSHGASVPAGARWLSISGQLGVAPDGTVPESFEEQFELCLDNMLVVLRADGMDIPDLVKIMIYVTPHGPDVIAAYRDIRDAKFEGHAPTATYIGVTSLAADKFLVEVDAMAAKVD